MRRMVILMMMISILMVMMNLLRRDRLSEMLVMKVWNDGLAKWVSDHRWWLHALHLIFNVDDHLLDSCFHFKHQSHQYRVLVQSHPSSMLAFTKSRPQAICQPKFCHSESSWPVPAPASQRGYSPEGGYQVSQWWWWSWSWWRWWCKGLSGQFYFYSVVIIHFGALRKSQLAKTRLRYKYPVYAQLIIPEVILLPVSSSCMVWKDCRYEEQTSINCTILNQLYYTNYYTVASRNVSFASIFSAIRYEAYKEQWSHI